MYYGTKETWKGKLLGVYIPSVNGNANKKAKQDTLDVSNVGLPENAALGMSSNQYNGPPLLLIAIFGTVFSVVGLVQIFTYSRRKINGSENRNGDLKIGLLDFDDIEGKLKSETLEMV